MKKRAQRKKPSAVPKATIGARPASRRQTGAPFAIGEVSSNRYSANGKPVSVTVSHRETFTGLRVVSANVYQSESWLVNPGRSIVPWLSTWAGAFDLYRINSMQIEYVPASAANNSGTLVMAFDYDPLDPVPDSFEALATFEGAVQCQIWKSATLVFHGRDRPLEQSYIASLGAVEDRFTDAGQFIFGYIGPTTGMLGRFFVTYSVTLFRPQLQVPLATFCGGIPNSTQLNTCPAADSPGRYSDATGISLLGTDLDQLTDGLKYDPASGIISLPASVKDAALKLFTDFTAEPGSTAFPSKTDPSALFKLTPVANDGGASVLTISDVGVCDKAPYSSGTDTYASAWRGRLQVPAYLPGTQIQFRWQTLLGAASEITHLRPYLEFSRLAPSLIPFTVPQGDPSEPDSLSGQRSSPTTHTRCTVHPPPPVKGGAW